MNLFNDKNRAFGARKFLSLTTTRNPEKRPILNEGQGRNFSYISGLFVKINLSEKATFVKWKLCLIFFFFFCSLNWNNYLSNYLWASERTQLMSISRHTWHTAVVPAHEHTKLLIYSPEASPFLPNCSPDWLPFNQTKALKILLGPKPVLSPPGHLLSLLLAAALGHRKGREQIQAFPLQYGKE